MGKDTSAFDEELTRDPATLAGLMKMAAQAEEMEANVAALEEALKHQKAALNILKTQQLPDAMQAVGLTEFKSSSGAEIKVTDFVAGSLPKEPDKRAIALDQLVKEGGTELIKNNVVVEFGRKQHNEAAALADTLNNQGYSAEMRSDVHPQTLMAFVREKLRNGEEVAYETLGCFVGRVVKIKLP